MATLSPVSGSEYVPELLAVWPSSTETAVLVAAIVGGAFVGVLVGVLVDVLVGVSVGV